MRSDIPFKNVRLPFHRWEVSTLLQQLARRRGFFAAHPCHRNISTGSRISNLLLCGAAPRSILGISSVSKGRLYEHSCKLFLEKKLAMQLLVCGGAGDQGVDLQGRWELDKTRDVIVQCKHYKQRLGPAAVREMEGTASYYTSSEMTSPLSIICAKSGFSTSSWKRAISGSKPLLLLHLDSDPAESITQDELLPLECRGAWCNPAFQSIAGAFFSTRTVHFALPGQPIKTIIDLRRTKAV